VLGDSRGSASAIIARTMRSARKLPSENQEQKTRG